MSAPVFHATPKGQPMRVLEIRRAELSLSVKSHGVRYAIYVQAAQPGATTDDRGVPGWDAPFEVTLDGGPDSTVAQAGEVALDHVAANDASMLYYWDHSPLDKTRGTLICDDDGAFVLRVIGGSQSGDQFEIDCPLTVTSVTSLEVGEDVLRGFFPKGADIEVKPMQNVGGAPGAVGGLRARLKRGDR